MIARLSKIYRITSEQPMLNILNMTNMVDMVWSTWLMVNMIRKVNLVNNTKKAGTEYVGKVCR